MKFMRLHLPALSAWIDDESTLEKCPACNVFCLEAGVQENINPYLKMKDQSTGHAVYLRCQCCAIPKFCLTKKVDLYKDNEYLKDYLLPLIKTKKNSWDRLVQYYSISNKNW